jgi:uncharacterized membrane protein YdbT with pleckstrin-like domain
MLIEKIALDADEVILKQVRKHWFIIATQLAGIVFAIVLLPVGFLIVSTLPVFELFAPYLRVNILTEVYTVILICAWMGGFSVWTNYYLDVWTITNKRLIAIDQRGLFHRDTGSFRLERLQDINVSVRGILGTLLGYGDLHAETASGDKDFIARGIPNPQELKALILKAADETTYREQPPGVTLNDSLPLAKDGV